MTIVNTDPGDKAPVIDLDLERLVHIDQRTIRDAIGRGELPAYRVGTKGTGVRIDRDDLREWLRSRPRVGSAADTG